MMKLAENKLREIASKEPYQGQFSSFGKLEKASKAYNEKLRKFAYEFPQYDKQILFSNSCVACAGKATIGECTKCSRFGDGKSKADLFEMHILIPKNNFNMDEILVFDMTYIPVGSKVKQYQVVLAKDKGEAELLLRADREVNKVTESNNLGAPLFKKV